MINEQWDNAQGIQFCIGEASTLFNKIAAIYKCHNLSLETKIRHIRCYVFSVLLYDTEFCLEATTKKWKHLTCGYMGECSEYPGQDILQT